MIIVIRSLDWMTKATLKIMFHLWYLCGIWLSWYITVDEGNEDKPFAFAYEKDKDLMKSDTENKKIKGEEEII